MKRIDYRSGMVFAIASIPGAVLGALSTAYVPRQAFDLIFGILMIVAAVVLWLTAGEKPVVEPTTLPDKQSAVSHRTERQIVDAEGISYRYAFDLRLGAVLSVFVGYLSSVLGIGGGIIHVPALSHWLHFPVHIATATSHFVLAVRALTGTLVHVATGVFVHGAKRTAILAVGVLVGAQVGAWLSNRIGGKSIIRALAVALAFVGLRLILSEL
jgi:uncharacterized membrane protein YfcA